MRIKQWIFLFLSLVMVFFFCACGNLQNNMESTSPALPQETVQDEKGTISNPYSMRDTITFTAQGYSRSSEKCISTYKICDIVLRNDIAFTGYETGHSRWLVTFIFEITESETDEPFRPSFEGTIAFGNINTDGISGGFTAFPRELNTYADVADIWDLEILPQTQLNVGCVLFNENGGDLSLITIEYYDEYGEKQTIYVDPNI